jgi:hypothetical protein
VPACYVCEQPVYYSMRAHHADICICMCLSVCIDKVAHTHIRAPLTHSLFRRRGEPVRPLVALDLSCNLITSLPMDPVALPSLESLECVGHPVTCFTPRRVCDACL